jgi:response regulator RpfG family c-di-GMP phosphodiesterase
MNDFKHTVLCVDDEGNVLHSLKRLFRKEAYRLLTAISGAEGLKILEEYDVQVVIADQRMPQMSGTEFLAIVNELYPQTMRIVLSGYTDVDTITESINKGHIYKFFLKPWNDQSLKLEIRQTLDQYDLIKSNRDLHEKVLKQNEELNTLNKNLKRLVQERTKELQIKDQALELTPAVRKACQYLLSVLE